MLDKKREQYRILKSILSKTKGISFDDLFELFNEKLIKVGQKSIQRRTFFYIIEDLRNGKLDKTPLNIQLKDNLYYLKNHQLNFYLNELNEEELHTIPFLYSILEKYKYLPAVNIFYKTLHAQLTAQQSSINILSAHVAIQNFQATDHMLQQMNLVNKILEFINRQQAIEFSYQSTSLGKQNEKDTGVVVYPLQIRQYLGKFYLIGTTKENPYSIRYYLLDNILHNKNRYFLEGHINEEDEDSDKIETFDYEKLARLTKLKHYFDHCIGIMREENSVPVEIRRWFKGWAATAVLSSPLHPTQIVIDPHKTYGDGRVLIQITVYDNVELHNVLAKFGKDSWALGDPEPTT